jgi:hypothetical protein
MEITWTIDRMDEGDHLVEIDDESIEGCDDVAEAMQMIERKIREDLRQSVHQVYDQSGIRAELERLFAERKTEEENA